MYLNNVHKFLVAQLKLVDCSSIVRFPSNSLQEWNEGRGFCLRNASAYLLVYDVTDDDSFRYVRSMRDQIVRCRDVRDVPIFIAANKQVGHCSYITWLIQLCYIIKPYIHEI